MYVDCLRSNRNPTGGMLLVTHSGAHFPSRFSSCVCVCFLRFYGPGGSGSGGGGSDGPGGGRAAAPTEEVMVAVASAASAVEEKEDVAQVLAIFFFRRVRAGKGAGRRRGG